MPLSWARTRELALNAEAAQAPIDLERERTQGAIVESTRSYPGYYFGNRFILDQAPTAQTINAWLLRYREHFAWRTARYPAVFSWFEPHASDAVTIGTHEVGIEVMCVAAKVAPVRSSVSEGERIVAFTSDSHWQQLVEMECAAYSYGHAFTQWRASSFRALMEAGRGAYYGIVDKEGALLCAAGGYYRNDVARFAGVITNPAHRGRGLASTLITDMLLRMQQRATAKVIVAEFGSKPFSLYESLGFVPFCYAHSLQIELP